MKITLFITLILVWALFSNACTSIIPARRPTYTLLPTYTAYPTSTIVPTNTPSPTPIPTKIPGVLECFMIIDRYSSGMTSQQYDEYNQSLINQLIYFMGKVEKVRTDGIILVGDINSACDFELRGVPQEIVNRIQEGQGVEGYGTILKTSYFGGLTVYIWDINFINTP